MRIYRLDVLSEGRVFRCEDIEAADDAAAVEQAHQLRGLAPARLWDEDDVLIAEFEPPAAG